jgi:uncharacterized delta-60 repeat protein
LICSFIEQLEPRLKFAAIQYGVAANGDPDVTGVLRATGPGLKDLGAKGVRLFTNTSYRSIDFDTTVGGKIYVHDDSLAQSLSYAKKYHDAGINVTLCIELTTDRSMTDGKLLVDSTGATRHLTPSELRSPKVFRTWYDTLSKAQISKADHTSATKVVDFWEIGNETNLGRYWPVDATLPGMGVTEELNSYVDHDLIPAYDVLHPLGEPVIGAGLGSGTFDEFNALNNEPGARHHQYSDHCDYLNFHPYGLLGSPFADMTPQGQVQAFTKAMYDDGTMTKPFVITEYNLSDFGHIYPLDPSANPRDSADQIATANDLEAARQGLLSAPHVKDHCAWIYYYRLIATDSRLRGGLFYPPPGGKGDYTPMPALYDMFKHWAKGTPATSAPAGSKGVLNLGAKPVTNAIAVQNDGKTLVLSDDGVRRYDTKGKLDSTYGVGGFLKLPMIGKVLALQGDGNLIVGGSQNDTNPKLYPYHLVVTRLGTSGRVDKGFGTKGYFALKDGSGSQAISIALRAGKIVIAGRSAGARDAVLIRLDLTGALDKTFPGGGAQMLKRQGVFTDVSIAKSGAITTLLTPYKLSPLTSVVRFNSKGDFDKTFSGDGISDPQPIADDGLFVNPDGSVLLVGHAPLAQRQVVTRFTAAGVLDTKFGVNGVATISGKKFIRGNAIELADGSRYLYGSIAPSLTSDSRRIFVSKLRADGQLDRSYGAGGVLTLASTGVQDLPFAAALNGSSLTIAAGAFTKDEEGGMTQELFPL